MLILDVFNGIGNQVLDDKFVATIGYELKIVVLMIFKGIILVQIIN